MDETYKSGQSCLLYGYRSYLKEGDSDERVLQSRFRHGYIQVDKGTSLSVLFVDKEKVKRLTIMS